MRRTSWILRTGTALSALVLVAAATAALAATTGKITGTVREKGKGALPGVTVVVDGTRLGARHRARAGHGGDGGPRSHDRQDHRHRA